MGSLAFSSLVGPLAVIPAMVFGVFIIKVSGLTHSSFSAEELKFTLMVSVIGLIYAYPLTMLIGMPLFILLRKFNKDNFITILFISQLPVLLMLAFTKGDYSSPIAISYFSACVSLSCYFLYRISEPLNARKESF